MEKQAFRGKFSGFLLIGEEKAEYDGKKLISYYAKPFCSDGGQNVQNCIEFSNGELSVRDVESSDGEAYSCIWEREDIESALDSIGAETEYIINEISCKRISELTITSVCQGIRSSAFEGSTELYKLIYTGSEQPNFMWKLPGNLYLCSANKFLNMSSKTKAKAHSVKSVRELMQYLPLERNVPDYTGKTFVLSGEFGDYYHDALHNMIPIMGGIVRRNISDETDYLVIYGCNSLTQKMQEAIEQKKKGHTVTVLFFEDIAESLRIRLSQADKDNFSKLLQYMWEFISQNDEDFTPALKKDEKCEKHSAPELHKIMQQIPFVHSVQDFKGKVFALVGKYCEDYQMLLHREIERRGGEVFGSLTKKTDIIVAYGCKSIIKPYRDAALEIKSKGRKLECILFEELAAELGIRLIEEDRQNYEVLCKELQAAEGEAKTASSPESSDSADQAPVKFKYKKNEKWAVKSLKKCRSLYRAFSLDKIKGKKFTISGRIDSELNDYIAELLIKHGGELDSKLNTSTNYIIVYGMDKGPYDIPKLRDAINKMSLKSAKLILFETFAEIMGIELCE